MNDPNRNCAGPENPSQESGSSASPVSFPFECRCERWDASYGVREECLGRPGRPAQDNFSVRLVSCATLFVLSVFLCGFVVCIECSMSNSGVDTKINQMKNEIQLLKEALTELKKQQDYQTNNLIPISQLTLQHQQQQLSRMKRDDVDESRADELLGEREKNDESRSIRHKRPHRNLKRKENRGKKCTCKKDIPAFHVTMPEMAPRNDEPTLASAEDGKYRSQNYIYGSWSVALNSSRDFELLHGNSIRVNSQGLYFVYSQILFHSAAAISAYRICKVSVKSLGDLSESRVKELVRCVTSVDQVKQNSTQTAENARYKTCYAGTIVSLEAGQRLQLRSDHNYTFSRQPNSNFFGLFRISA